MNEPKKVTCTKCAGTGKNIDGKFYMHLGKSAAELVLKLRKFENCTRCEGWGWIKIEIQEDEEAAV